MARGDRLVTERRLTGCGPTYLHYGIDMGDGTVVHTRPHRFERLWRGGSVVRTSHAEFANGQPVRVVNEPPAAFPPDEIAGRAERHVGREGYSPVIDNCEHFATWCATGMRQSRQVDIIASRVGRVAGKASAVASSRLAQRRISRVALDTAARRTAVRGLPAMLVAEGVALAVEWKAHRAGHDEHTSRRAGDAAGLAMSAATFAIAGAVGGPLGALMGAVTGATAWAGGSLATQAAGWAGGRVLSGVTSLSSRRRQTA
jgi:hypothetical protein